MIKILGLLGILFTLSYSADTQRMDIPAKAYISLVNEDIDYLARIDSGARISSIHALNIKLEGDKPFIYLKDKQKPKVNKPFEKEITNQEYKRNIGRMISFETVNEEGLKKLIKARVVDVVKVRNAQGVEYRYVIRLGFKYKGVEKYKEVNLRDRSNMKYKLLIGRNWLHYDFNIKTEMKLIEK